MLRLNLKDNDDTVLFVNPVNGVEIHKITDRLSFRTMEWDEELLMLGGYKKRENVVIDSWNNIKKYQFVRGEQEKPGLRLSFATCGGGKFMHAVVLYSDFESRDRAYGYVLTKIDEYLFPPQVELGPICQNDFAMPEEGQ